MFSFLYRNSYSFVKNAFYSISPLERKFIWWLSLFITPGFIDFMICSWLKKQVIVMPILTGLFLCSLFFIYIFLRQRYKNKKKGVAPSPVIIESYVYLFSIKNQFNIKTLISTIYIDFCKLVYQLDQFVKKHLYFFKKNWFNKFNHTVNSNNYIKTNKNYRRYTDILKKYK